GVRTPDVLDGLPDSGRDERDVPIARDVIAQVTGETCAIPELRSPTDLTMVSRIAFSIPALADAPWNIGFGRELNASDDRAHFVERGGAPRRQFLPIVEGKQIQAFTVDVDRSRFHPPARP